jgi:hypothetical protein
MRYPPLIFSKPKDKLVKDKKEQLFSIFRKRSSGAQLRQSSQDRLESPPKLNLTDGNDFRS